MAQDNASKKRPIIYEFKTSLNKIDLITSLVVNGEVLRTCSTVDEKLKEALSLQSQQYEAAFLAFILAAYEYDQAGIAYDKSLEKE